MDTQLTIGSVLLDKYRVERVLGQGGMGIVVAVRHIDLGQLHAMKFLLPDALGHQEAVERFLREARAAAVLRSHHAVRVLDVARMPNEAPYMVMEYLEGCDLKKYLDRQGPLPIDEAMRFVLQACDAIAEAHGKGIIHRDLKPANLFLAQQRDGDPIIKVVDFGISKYTIADDPDLTDTNATLGSPSYMSPEQIDKSKSVDLRTDIWSLGVVAYELLTGECPFRAPSLLQIALKINNDEPPPLSNVRPDVPEALAAAITRCLRKKREERWASIEEFAAVLEEFVPQTLPMRLSQRSVTNERSFAKKIVFEPKVQVPTLTNMPNEIESTLPLGERTGLTFGTTKMPIRRARTAPRMRIATLFVIVIGFAVSRDAYIRVASLSNEAAKLLRQNRTLIGHIPSAQASTPIALLSAAQSNAPRESFRKEIGSSRTKRNIIQEAPVPAPSITSPDAAKQIIKNAIPAESTEVPTSFSTPTPESTQLTHKVPRSWR